MINSRLREVIKTFAEGGVILLHDDGRREDEVDMLILGEHVSPASIRLLRREAGGLLCMAIDGALAEAAELPFYHQLVRGASGLFPTLSELLEERMRYGDRPAFSITLNHRSVYTGITDRERAYTIRRFAELCKEYVDRPRELKGALVSEFFTPGHVHLLISSKNLFGERHGHTEYAVALAKLARRTPVVALAEMLDDEEPRALPIEKAEKVAKERGYALLRGYEIEEMWRELVG